MDFADENPIITRLKQYIDNTGLSITQFADRAGIPRPTFSQLLSGRNKTINNQVLAKLNENFPDLDILWLLFGRPSGRASSNFEISEPQIPAIESENATELPDAKDDVETHSAGSATVEQQKNSRSPRMAAESIGAYGSQVRDEPYVEYKRSGSFPSLSPSVSTSVPAQSAVSMSRVIKQIVIFYTDNSFEVYDPS